ncbi:hypothetical protein OG689_03855 [Kitasatospora sp. NBC_00240]|uniref:polysaccharide lyase family 8 super-sandwich domain-containing protein n=1 Tax=Kitasatospora sp. NBC_00240 TaxID=2903567 RepID=UPI00225BC1C7|nr:polysaccharide lyase family 8 super-sandwich domain-containing protein [Kitasatospora sp. NBC_00240]MCX5208438.1 hypothetical protein [Kitasatospora sp. NBC_00240]
MNDATVVAGVEPPGATVFHGMDRAMVRRPGWAAPLSLCSARTTFYETGNGDNLRGWHTNNGVVTWWGSDFGNGHCSEAL